jgi:hypothetical protein
MQRCTIFVMEQVIECRNAVWKTSGLDQQVGDFAHFSMEREGCPLRSVSGCVWSITYDIDIV